MSAIIPFNPDTTSPDQYTADKGAYIAEEFASGESLKVICEDSDNWLPSMLIVKRWRRMFPAFDAMMIEAAECRAENHAEAMLIAAKDTNLQAAQARNQMTAHEKLAGWMSPSAYGDRKQQDPAASDTAPVFMLTDEQLLAIAAGKMPAAIEGECLRVEDEGGAPPPGDDRPGTEYEVSGLQKPESIPVEHSVTTIDSDEEKNFVEPGERGGGGLSFIGMDD